ncbi:MAG: ATP-binding protein [Bacteroidota bacterium]
MIKKSTSPIFILALDAIIFLLCIIGIYHISEKAALPLQIDTRDDALYVSNIEDKSIDVLINDKIISIENIQVADIEEVECILDGISIGNKVVIVLERGDENYEVQLRTVPFYTSYYLMIASFVSLFFFIIGIIVLIKKPELNSAKLFHAATVSTGVIMATTWGNYSIEPLGVGYVIRVIFSAAYSFAPIFFIDFVLSLRERKNKSYQYVRPALYIIAITIFILQAFSFLNFVNVKTIDSIQLYLSIFSIFRIYLMTYILIGLGLFIYTYLSTTEEYEQKKLRWILYGLSIGLVGFLSLWIFPYLITSQGLVPEEILLLIVLFIPITFAISIVRYRLLNIDLIIERSIVYFLAILLILLCYAAVISFIASKIDIPENPIAAIITATLVAVFFQPVNAKLQSFVNKKFFRIKYNFREALTSIVADIKEENDIAAIASKVVEKIDGVIPNEKIGFFIKKPISRELILLANNWDDENTSNEFSFENYEIFKNSENPLAKLNAYEPGAAITLLDSTPFENQKLEIFFPLKDESEQIIGIIALGKKKSETRFTLEDIDLLKTITSRIGNILERIRLQEELITERLETERLEELNELKSLYVSTVTHDLKTPLTSIKMFAEILKEKKNLDDEKYEDYLQIIEGESDRLTRLINNVLDYAKIEKGLKDFKHVYLNINNIVIDVLKLMDYQFNIQKFDVETNLSKEKIIIYGDKDAITSVLINLFSNAIKYSDKRKKIIVSTTISEKYYELSVKDHGLGIKESDLDQILIPYFRSDDTSIKNTVGTGLGLAIIKHTMQAHKGDIIIKSKFEEGSTFTLIFPKGGKDEEDINN